MYIEQAISQYFTNFSFFIESIHPGDTAKKTHVKEKFSLIISIISAFFCCSVKF